MFTENQSRQLYVVTATTADVIAPVQVDSTHAATDLSAKSAGACQLVTNKEGDEMYFTYKGPSTDGVQRTDRIKKGCITYVNVTAAADLRHKKRRLKVALDSNVNSGNAVAGQDYVLTVAIKNYMAAGDDSVLYKYGVAHATSTTASDLYEKLAISLAKNFAREATPLVKVYLTESTTYTEVTAADTMSTLTPTAAFDGVALEEVEQPWRRGAAPVEYVNFDLVPSTIYVSSEDVIWGTVTDTSANYIVNSKKVADMEWFFHKERGDKYGEVGFPYNIDTTYQVNPSNANGYSIVDIHYFTEGNSMNVGKSEKTITLAFPAASGSAPEADVQKLLGNATGGSETGIYAFLKGTGVSVKTSASYDPS